MTMTNITSIGTESSRQPGADAPAVEFTESRRNGLLCRPIHPIHPKRRSRAPMG
jgi:hypothetical protein